MLTVSMMHWMCSRCGQFAWTEAWLGQHAPAPAAAARPRRREPCPSQLRRAHVASPGKADEGSAELQVGVSTQAAALTSGASGRCGVARAPAPLPRARRSAGPCGGHASRGRLARAECVSLTRGRGEVEGQRPRPAGPAPRGLVLHVGSGRARGPSQSLEDTRCRRPAGYGEEMPSFVSAEGAVLPAARATLAVDIDMPLQSVGAVPFSALPCVWPREAKGCAGGRCRHDLVYQAEGRAPYLHPTAMHRRSVDPR